ncbi:MAG: hypothetical protein MHM6MM_001446 [Cercozoa sp. M6MM]
MSAAQVLGKRGMPETAEENDSSEKRVCQQSLSVPVCDLPQPPSATARNFSRFVRRTKLRIAEEKAKCDENEANEQGKSEEDASDWHMMYIDAHLNGLVVVGFAPEHACRSNAAKRCVEVSFVIDGVDLGGVVPRGKRKNGGVVVRAGKPMCRVRFADDSWLTVPSPVTGDIFECNALLKERPQLASIEADDRGFLMVLRPRNPKWQNDCQARPLAR